MKWMASCDAAGVTYLALLRGQRLVPARDSRRHAHHRRGCRLRRQLAHVPRLRPICHSRLNARKALTDGIITDTGFELKYEVGAPHFLPYGFGADEVV